MEVGKTTESIFPRKRTCPIGRSPERFLSIWKTSEDLLPVHLILYERNGVVKNTLTFLLPIWKVLLLFYLLYHSKPIFNYLYHPPYCSDFHRYKLISKAHKILPAQVHSVIWHFLRQTCHYFQEYLHVIISIQIQRVHSLHMQKMFILMRFLNWIYLQRKKNWRTTLGLLFLLISYLWGKRVAFNSEKKISIIVMLMFVCLVTKTSTAAMTMRMMKMKMIVMLVMTIRRPLSSICPYTSSCFPKHTHRLIQCLIP